MPLSLTAKRAFARSLPPQNEFDVMRRLGAIMSTIWPRGLLPDADGAMESNKTGYINVLFQYHTFGLLPLALLHKNIRYTDAMLRTAEYAFRHQRPDGSFDYSESNGTFTTKNKAGPLSAASSATFFLSDLGHTLLLLPQDPWFARSPECAGFRARLEKIRSKVGISLQWLLTQRAILAMDRAASNRTIAHALAYYFPGRAVGNADAMAAGRSIFRSALDAVTPDGVFIEAGGFDSSYQAFNVLQCEWMYLNLAPADADLRESTWSVIRRGIGRERPSVTSSGEISTAGNTRIREHDPAYGGHHVNAKQILLALGYYGVMASDPAVMAETRRIFSFYYPHDKIDF
ncbi:MAG: hypothetical protein GIW94_05255 [Candidatus Eremiobacteraeota bacterium]|nr:hypothetical protein [Candidatus Eremiobacteraeota bacterium]